MKEFFIKLEEWFQPVEDYIIGHHQYIKYGLWGFLILIILYIIAKDILGRSK